MLTNPSADRPVRIGTNLVTPPSDRSTRDPPSGPRETAVTGTVSWAVRVDLIGMVSRTEAPTSAAGGSFTVTRKDTWKPSAPSVPGRPATEVTRPLASMPSVGSSTRTFAPARTRPACSTRS